MNFLKAMKAVKEGETVKRKGQIIITYWDDMHDKVLQSEEGYDFNKFIMGCFRIKDYEATDWEIVEDDANKTFKDDSYNIVVEKDGFIKIKLYRTGIEFHFDPLVSSLSILHKAVKLSMERTGELERTGDLDD